ncbi:competence protein CoiA family protein, partial [Romboutsia sp.]|uniref:competence protein CoiA family protein n=1 Tax=Romboutsia sp. TaxID=1965302 RepID=UPI003F671818
MNSRLKHVKNINKGVNDIICPECGEKLILKDGRFMIKHLAHKLNNGDDCS